MIALFLKKCVVITGWRSFETNEVRLFKWKNDGMNKG